MRHSKSRKRPPTKQLNEHMAIFLSAISAGILAMGSLSASAQASLPWGILHAPGIEKRIENGKGLPHGIEKKLDVRLPIGLNISLTGITSTGATVSWTTNASTTGKVIVDTERLLVEADAKVFADANLATSHSVNLTGLEPNTKYFYAVQSVDAAGNVRTSATLSFTTAVAADVTAPRIMALYAVSVTKDSAKIVWITDERADAKVWVSTASPVVTTGAATQASADLALFHEMTLTGLTPSTVYRYVVRSVDAAGNVTLSGEASFATTAN